MPKLKKPRSYSDYTLDHLKDICGVDNQQMGLNLQGKLIEPSDWLKLSLAKSKLVPLNTEKAKSELLIMPVLMELLSLMPQKFNLFSGNSFEVDVSKALRGRCDFLLTKKLSFNISAPIMAVFEAKDDNLEHWYGQCGAEMYAAWLFNEMKHEPVAAIYGAVTNGYEWSFLCLKNQLLLIDTDHYSLENLPRLLGVLVKLINFYYEGDNHAKIEKTA